MHSEGDSVIHHVTKCVKETQTLYWPNKQHPNHSTTVQDIQCFKVLHCYTHTVSTTGIRFLRNIPLLLDVDCFIYLSENSTKRAHLEALLNQSSARTLTELTYITSHVHKPYTAHKEENKACFHVTAITEDSLIQRGHKAPLFPSRERVINYTVWQSNPNWRGKSCWRCALLAKNTRLCSTIALQSGQAVLQWSPWYIKIKYLGSFIERMFR